MSRDSDPHSWPSASGGEDRGLDIRLYQRTPIALDVELQCAAGEMLALVGPSGSGKTTVLRCIAGLHRPAAGWVRCHGQTWTDVAVGTCLPPQQRRVGMMFQDYALFPHLSALDNVAVALDHLPRAERRRRAGEVLERVHLGGLAARRPARLSGGQQQRVALARALARGPGVLLLDEPFSAVDQVTRRKLRLELAELTRSLHIPIILVTHDLDEAAMLAQRLCVIHAGRSLQTGAPAEVLRRPKDGLVARLMDVRNLFEGHVVEHRPEQGLTLIDWAGLRFETPYEPRFAVGEAIVWMLPPDAVLLHQRRRPSRGHKENPLTGRIVELLTIGGTTQVLMRVHHGRLLYMDLPPHVVQRNSLAIGNQVTVSLLSGAIHLMPRQGG